MKVGQEGDNVGRDERSLAGQVQLNAVTGTDNDRLAVMPGIDGFEAARQVVAVECQPFAQLDRRLVIVAADAEEVHDAPPLPMCGMTSVTSSSTNATMVRKATRRPRRCSPKRM